MASKRQQSSPKQTNPQSKKSKRSQPLDLLHRRFMQTKKGSPEYNRAGNELMEKVFSGK